MLIEEAPFEDRKASFLEVFEVSGLHLSQNVRLDMNFDVAIFIADNGSGKTTALYMLNCILSRQYSNLLKFEFKSFSMKFRDASPFVIGRDEIASRRTANSRNRMITRTGLSHFELAEVARITRAYPYERARASKSFFNAAKAAKLPTRSFYELMQRYNIQNETPEDVEIDLLPFSRLDTFLRDNFKHKVVYLPTYRRVEQDLKSFARAELESEESLFLGMEFGMRDVSHRISHASRQIREKFFASYGQIAGQMLGQLSQPIPISDQMKDFLHSRDNIQIVLSRAGSNVSGYQRESILSLFDQGNLLDNQPLSFFLSSLVEANEAVKPIETGLKSYASVCNGYLLNKEFRYDSFNAKLTLFDLLTESELRLESLSSGEKQILGVMSQVYLGQDPSYVVIFDEPELSLSVEWQQKILVDVMSADKCKMLVAATHSPFVFQNYLDRYATALKAEFVKPLKEA